ncbi:hypothetical protein Glove_144g124 [Diversispora epigaea]|uniref:Uncharacterized protein n=1 Tax=Diversispora epigaea TaxID=1348612 RepID=A0A397IU31_9GLOM|nr:hypothetical protein Glove_144g124 [Diversispora epigaea]
MEKSSQEIGISDRVHKREIKSIVIQEEIGRAKEQILEKNVGEKRQRLTRSISDESENEDIQDNEQTLSIAPSTVETEVIVESNKKIHQDLLGVKCSENMQLICQYHDKTYPDEILLDLRPNSRFSKELPLNIFILESRPKRLGNLSDWDIHFINENPGCTKEEAHRNLGIELNILLNNLPNGSRFEKGLGVAQGNSRCCLKWENCDDDSANDLLWKNHLTKLESLAISDRSLAREIMEGFEESRIQKRPSRFSYINGPKVMDTMFVNDK